MTDRPAQAVSDLSELENMLTRRPRRGAATSTAPSTAPGPGSAQTRATAQPTPEPSPSAALTAGPPDQPAGERKGTRGQAPASGARTTHRVVMVLDPEVAEAVREHRRYGRTNADVIFDAIEQVGLAQLQELLPHRTTRAVPPGGMFSRSTGQVALNKVRFEARLLPADCDLIDQVVADSGAASRSQLIETALQAHLLQAGR